MAQRTSPILVQRILADNYDNVTATDLQQFIDTATVIVDRVVTCAAAKGKPLTVAEAELIERWLSAHAYQANDPGYTSRSTAGASGSFEGGQGEGISSTRYGRMAIALDWSGCLDNLNKRNRVTITWLGKTPSEQIPYDQRS